jgi:hypothetical protein
MIVIVSMYSRDDDDPWTLHAINDVFFFRAGLRVMEGAGSPAVTSSHAEPTPQVGDSVALDAKKAPQDILRRFPKMERAKRLEISNQSSDTPTPAEGADSAAPADTQLSTQAGLELAEIVSAWPRLRPEIRGAILTLARLAVADK